MTTPEHPTDRRVPSPEEVQALIRRAHHERGEAIRRIVGGLFRRAKSTHEAQPPLHHGAPA